MSTIRRSPPGRARSSFVAAVLSVLFPGLGHAYAGAWSRAFWWAAGPFLLLAAAVGVVISENRFTLAGIALQSWFLTGAFVANLGLLGYRLIATIDAWRTVRRLNATEAGQPGPTSSIAGAMSGAGLIAALIVLAGAHVAFAHYDLLASSLADCVFDATGTAECGTAAPGASPGQSPEPLDTSGAALSLPPEGSPLPETTAPPWTGKERLNILLVGVDQRPGDATFNTDTMIVVSIDPTTNRVAMFSIPRDTVDVPLPPGPLQRAFGAVYPAKINSLWTAVHGRPDLCPGPNATSRGFNCLKSVIGDLYGLNVQYYAEVNFSGFVQVVDALGGVTIAVQAPVVDDTYPTGGHGDERIYIPSGVQHMNGAQALIYARSRHASNDFDRGARQQRVLTSLLAETDIGSILPKLDQLVGAFEQTVRTDIPRELLPQLLGLADKIDIKAIRSFVFAPPLYETEDYIPGVHDFLYPRTALIRSAVRTAFTSDPNFEAERVKVAEEGATVWVLNGSGQASLASDIASYLDYLGFGATAPTQKPSTLLNRAQIVVYNGAQERLPETIKRLEAIFGVSVVMKVNPAVHVDVVVTVGRSTPDLTPPPLP